MGLVDGRGAGHADKTLGRGQGVGDGLRFGGLGAGDGVHDDHVRVIAQGGVDVGILVGVDLGPLGGELLGHGVHVGHGRVIGEGGVHETFHGAAADGGDLRVVHGVAAHDPELGAQLLGLLHDDGAFGEVGGDEQDFRLLAHDFLQLGSEILVAGLVVQGGHDFAAQLGEGLVEEAGQAHGIVVGHVDQKSGLLEAQILEGIGGSTGALERIDEAHAEDVLLALGDQGVGAAGANLRDAGLFGHFTTGHGQGRTVGADDGLNFFLFDQALDRVGGFNLVGFVIDHEQLDFLAENIGHFLMGHLHAFQFQLATKGILAGQGQKHADFYGVIGCQGHAGEAANHGQYHAQDSKSFHQKLLQGER